MDSKSVLNHIKLISIEFMIMNEYIYEDNIENDDEGIFVISQKFQEIAQQGLDRFVQLSIFYFCELPLYTIQKR